MAPRDRFREDLKAAMKGGDARRVSTIRLILARVKEADIAARPRGVDQVSDDEIAAVLRSMVKQRRDSIALYRQGGREELAAGEATEIAVIEGYLPAALDDAALDRAVAEAIAATGAVTVRDIGRVMSALKTAHGASLDMGRVNEAVRTKLG